MVIFYLPLCVFAVVMLKEGYQQMGRLCIPIPNDTKMLILLAIIPIVAVHYLISYVLKRNEKALRMLVEQMSDTDFELLLKIRDNFSFPYKYDLPFVLSNNHLYIFLFHTIKEIDPTQIISVKWHSTKYGFLVRIKDPKAKVTVFNISKSALPLFLQIVGQYTELKFNY